MNESTLDKAIRLFEEFFTTVTDPELPFYVSHGQNMKLLGRELFETLLGMSLDEKYKEDPTYLKFVTRANEIVEETGRDWTLREFSLRYLNIAL